MLSLQTPTVSPLLDEVGHEGKAETFNSFITSIFNTDNGPQDAQSPGLEDQDCGSDEVPTGFELVQELLLQLNAHKTTGPDEIQPRLLKE